MHSMVNLKHTESTFQINTDISSLNEADTFGNVNKKGWVLPSVEPVTLNLYLYYDGKHQEKLDEFFEINEDNEEFPLFDSNGQFGVPDYEVYRPKADLYMYFTTEQHCNEYKPHRPLEVIEKIGQYLSRMDYLGSTGNAFCM